MSSLLSTKGDLILKYQRNLIKKSSTISLNIFVEEEEEEEEEEEDEEKEEENR